jgi:hypothetical protein
MKEIKCKELTWYIKDLKENEIFVFGSNVSGRHGKGAAKTAMKWGAKYGVGNGIYGKTYAIPTVDKQIKNALSLSSIKMYVDQFIKFATNNTQYIFLVTEIGCGLAGYTVKDIAPLFKEALYLENIYLPKKFMEYLI